MRFVIELVTEHDYLVRVDADGDTVQAEFYLDPDLLQRLGVPDADERQVVEQTAMFLAERQPVIDFPSMVDLADVLAAYVDYPQRLRELLAR
ncbi:MAG TPA: hypothetical protein VFW65_05455 [Pseudonocardiaceae bacterium]|nr:hypothetical protein [Pseudonocardiaceae bacterium]